MKPIDVESDSFAKYNEEFNEKDPNLKYKIMLPGHMYLMI